MKTISRLLFIPLLLTLLATGCTKDKGRIRLMASPMNGSKVFVPASGVNDATWVVGETINLNGTSYAIGTGSDNLFYLYDANDNAVAPLESTMYAIYPATLTTGGNNVAVTNNGSSGATITINRLAVNFHDDGYDIVFPMASKANANSNRLLFHHLTGGLKLTLSAQTSCTVATLKVVTFGTGAASAVTIEDVPYTVRWAVQGPNIPTGGVGGIEGDRDVKYASEMWFDLRDGTNPVTITSDGITFSVPVTVNNVNRITVIGYDANGAELFAKTQNLTSTTIQVNYMYTVPEIQIN